MTRNDKRGRRAAALVERAILLNPNSRRKPEVIVVATIRALALNPGLDLLEVLKAVADRHITIRALADDLEIPPGAGIDIITAAAAAWDKGRRNNQTLAGRAKGNAAAAARAAERRKKAVSIAGPLWGKLDEISSIEIAKKAGVSVTTLYRALGQRRKGA
jgi:DNA invertase Pin-like site-specific DNA recombinase